MPVIEVRRERTILIPVDVVWALIEPAEALPAWLPLAERCERVAGEGLGRTQRMYGRWGRRHVEIDQQVIAYEPHALLRWTHLAERVNGKPAPRFSTEVTLTIRLTSNGPGTRVVLESRNVAPGALAAQFVRWIGRPRIARAFDRALANLAAAGR